jgi:hypothetical protein
MPARLIVAAPLAAVLLASSASPARAQSDKEAIKALVQTAYADGLQEH